MSYTDPNGTVHEVTVTEERHDYWTAGGTLHAVCACAWEDRLSYEPGNPFAEALTAQFADLRLRERAVAHLS
jgi:hypothetical protein